MAVDRMQRQRFEIKYVIDEATALGVREYAQSHIDLDEAGKDKPDFSYQVNSIYLDSLKLYTFWDWVNANRNRFKLRMRYYDSSMNEPLFLEIKRRVNSCILKQRCIIRKRAAQKIIDGQFPPDEDILSKDAKGMAALENFIKLVIELQAQPRALVTYMREAYIDPENDGIRLTMDRRVRIAPRTTCDFSLNMNHYTQPFGNMIILELKFNNFYPMWFNEMVQTLNLTRGAAAKYCEGVASLWHPEHGNQSAKLANGSKRSVASDDFEE